jgi:hypothetical protein
MDFRWVAGIALWTFLSGPAIGPPAGAGINQRPHAAAAARRSVQPPIKRDAKQQPAAARDNARGGH